MTAMSNYSKNYHKGQHLKSNPVTASVAKKGQGIKENPKNNQLFYSTESTRQKKALKVTGSSNTPLKLNVPIDRSLDSKEVQGFWGGEIFNIGIHWLTAYSDSTGIGKKDLNFWREQIGQFGNASIELIDELSINSPNPKLQIFNSEIKNDFGSFLRYVQLEDGNYQIWLSITGENLEHGMSSYQQFKAIYDCYRTGLHCTRLDLAVIDYQKLFKWSQVTKAMSDGNYTGFRKHDPIFAPAKRGEHSKGFTATFGTRKCEKFCRIYETTEKHGYAANKIEIEFKQRQANQLGKIFYQEFRFLLDDFSPLEKYVNKFCELIKNYILGSIDFIDMSAKNRGNRSIKDCKRLSWWDKFCKALGGVKIKLKMPKSPPTLKKTAQWFVRQVLPTLAMFYYGLDDDFSRYLSSQIFSATERLSKNQLLGIRVLQKLGIAGLGSYRSQNPLSKGDLVAFPKLCGI